MTNMQEDTNKVVIKVIGVGGGGGNAVNRMISAFDFKDVDFINVNTDKQILIKASAPTKIGIGDRITKGYGAGSNVKCLTCQGIDLLLYSVYAFGKL